MIRFIYKHVLDHCFQVYRCFVWQSFYRMRSPGALLPQSGWTFTFICPICRLPDAVSSGWRLSRLSIEQLMNTLQNMGYARHYRGQIGVVHMSTLGFASHASFWIVRMPRSQTKRDGWLGRFTLYDTFFSRFLYLQFQPGIHSSAVYYPLSNHYYVLGRHYD